MDRVKKRLFGSVQRLSDERILDKLAEPAREQEYR